MPDMQDQLPQDSERVEAGVSVIEPAKEPAPPVVWEGDVVIEVGEV